MNKIAFKITKYILDFIACYLLAIMMIIPILNVRILNSVIIDSKKLKKYLIETGQLVEIKRKRKQ